MKLELKRIFKGETYTIGKLYIDGEYFCDTIEDTVRDLKTKEDKIYAQTAIPAGEYDVNMNIISPKFSKRKDYDWCRGRLPRLMNVPFFEGILIHSGNTERSSAGCIIVGYNTVKGRVTDSMNTMKKLWVRLNVANEMGDDIKINIS